MDKIAVMNVARENKRQKRLLILNQKAERYFYKHENSPLFIAGIMLYWAEGKSTKREIYNLELNNSNPKLLHLYCKFLRRHMHIENKKFRARLFLYPDLNETKIRNFWSHLLKIPETQFVKSYISHGRSSLTSNKLLFGTCSVYISGGDLRSMMATWIELFAAQYE